LRATAGAGYMKIAGCVIGNGTGVIRLICAGAIINKKFVTEVSSYNESVNTVVIIHVSIFSCPYGAVKANQFDLEIDGNIREIISVLFA